MIKNDKIVVVDVESTCWEKDSTPPGEKSEIIEVGICLLDKFTGEITNKDGIIVRPQQSTVSEFCTTLTGWTQDQVDLLGIPFSDACHKIKKAYAAKGRVWASWGDYDRKMFTNECRDLGVDYPFTPQHLNVKQMVTFLSDNTKGLGLPSGLEFLGLKFEGQHHKGADDAYNIARALWEVRKLWNGIGGR
jgi:inhibitor of KinA sporulation pathway (predicted exonuclease)